MKMVKLFVKGVILVLICTLFGCGGQQKQEESPLFWIDDFTGITYSQQGAFYYESGLVHFLDVQNGTDSFICDDSLCNHNGGKGSVCSAYISATVLSAIFEEDHLLLVTDYGAHRVGELSLYQTDTDGSNRKQIASLGNMQCILDLQITEEVIVLAYYNNYSANMMPLDKDQTGIYVYNREEKKGEFVWSLEGHNARVSNAFYKDNVVYFWYFHYGNGENPEKQRIDQLCMLNLETREVTVIEEGLDDGECICVWNDKILYPYQNEVWQYNTVTGEKSLAVNQKLVPLSCYFTEWMLLRNGSEYYAYNGDELRKIADYDKIGVMAAYPNVIYGYNYNTENGRGVKVYWTFEDFLEGNIDSMKLFEK